MARLMFIKFLQRNKEYIKGFEVKKITRKKKRISMIKLDDSNKMHFNPPGDIMERFLEESKAARNRTAEEEKESDLCAICYTNKIDAVIQNCNHCEICSECALVNANLNAVCPFCRTVLNDCVLAYPIENEWNHNLQKNQGAD